MRGALGFSIALALASPALAQATTPVSVSGVAANDVLNLRAAPDAKSNILATLPPDATNLAVTAQGTSSLDWIEVRKGKAEGWVHARYLVHGGTKLPVRLSCHGTEPFWGIEISYSRVDADFAFTGKKLTIGVNAPLAANGRPDLWLLPGAGKAVGSFLLVESKACSDGMSGRAYRYALTTRIGGQLLVGCCR